MNKKSWPFGVLAVSLLVVLFLTGCSLGKREIAYQDGSFNGASSQGNIQVTLTVQDSKITNVRIDEFDDAGNKKDIETYQVCVPDGTAPLLAEAHPTLAQRIIDKNDWDVDVFSGATASSTGIKEAAKQALETAQK